MSCALLQHDGEQAGNPSRPQGGQIIYRLRPALASLFAVLATVAPATAQSVELAVSMIDSASLRATVYDLAADSMLGRDTSRPEIVGASRYIAARFKDSGLLSPTDGDMVQWWTAEDVYGPNVIGWIEGSDPALSKKHVLFVAHFDHMGFDARLVGDSIFNGADDNASGTAALIALARAFGRLEPAPPRSLVFLAVSGEELLMLGSKAYVRCPAFPLAQLHSVVNVDMIGRNKPDRISVEFYTESKYGPMTQSIAEAHAELGLAVALRAGGWHLRDGGDAWSFRNHTHEIVQFNSGIHEDFHTVDDEADRLDYGKMERVTRLIFLLGIEMAGGSE